MNAETIETSIGTVPVLHSLALGLVVLDLTTEREAVGPLLVGWEASGYLLRGRSSSLWPCVDFERVADGRFRLRATSRRPDTLAVRVDDPSRRYVPRRFRMSLWTYAELSDNRPATQVSVRSRTMRVWLYPGAAYPVSPGSTAIRGRVTTNGRPLPWARVSARSGGALLGRAHTDDRGEFLLLVPDVNQNPIQSTVSVQLGVVGDAGATDLPPIEQLTRPSNPALTSDLDNPLLRGETAPNSYIPSTTITQVTVDVGKERVLTEDVPYTP